MESTQEVITVRGEDSFLYLDMEMFCSKRGELQFRVHLKANQQLKYLNRGSTHNPRHAFSISIRDTQTSGYVNYRNRRIKTEGDE